MGLSQSETTFRAPTANLLLLTRTPIIGTSTKWTTCYVRTVTLLHLAGAKIIFDLIFMIVVLLRNIFK